jgi:Protein of unknown function (DUF5672)
MKKELVTVVIPIRLEELPELEKVSLEQTLRILNKYTITFMTQQGLNTAWYQEFCRGKATVKFEEFKWNGFNEFGELMTSANFYGRFRAYEYMLICHTDAFVFRDELEKWCNAGYDYIASLIYNTFWEGDSLPISPLLGFSRPAYYGNGGFALKRVEAFYRITSRFKLYLDFFHWLRRIRNRGFLDDIFVAQLFPNLSPKFNVAPKSLAQQFGAAYEFWDEKDLPFTNKDHNTLPFGMHGFIKYHPEFWIPVIRECGYAV